MQNSNVGEGTYRLLILLVSFTAWKGAVDASFAKVATWVGATGLNRVSDRSSRELRRANLESALSAEIAPFVVVGGVLGKRSQGSSTRSLSSLVVAIPMVRETVSRKSLDAIFDLPVEESASVRAADGRNTPLTGKESKDAIENTVRESIPPEKSPPPAPKK